MNKRRFLRQYQGYFGVRLEYPISRHAMIAVTSSDFRTTEENYDACIRELSATLEHLGIQRDNREIREIAWRSKG